MKYLKALLVLLLALVLAGFIQQNSETTVIRYFGWRSPALPLSLFFIIAFAVGYLLALLLGFTGEFRSRVRLFKAEREARRLKSELTQARLSRPEESGTGMSISEKSGEKTGSREETATSTGGPVVMDENEQEEGEEERDP